MVQVGYQNFVSKNKIAVVAVYKGQAIINKLKANKDKYIDCTQGRKTRSLIFLTDGSIVGSSIETISLIKRLAES